MALRLEDLLEQLHHPEIRLRERAVRKLARMGRDGFTPEQGLLVLKASSLPYPPRRDPSEDTAVDLIRAALQVPFPEYLPQIVDRYPLWHNRARREILHLLMRIEDPRAASAVMTIIRRHARAGDVPRLPLGMYEQVPQSPEAFFPELLEYLDVSRLGFPICALTLHFAAANLIDPAILAPHAAAIHALYERRRKRLCRAQRARGIAWRWEPRYHARRWQAGILLDLLGYLPGPETLAALRRALLEFTDPRLRLYALLSLLRLDQDVDRAVVAQVADDPEARKWLFDGLQKLERFSLYPGPARQQDALAESDLVNWLIHPSELGRAPDDLELVQKIPFDTGTEDGWADYFLFRFRTEPPHWSARYGWIAGVSGPFLRKDQPSIQALGDTFSAFTPWESKSRQEHVEDVRELIKTWRDRHVSQEE